MTQPPDESRPMPRDTPPDDAADAPTLAWDPSREPWPPTAESPTAEPSPAASEPGTASSGPLLSSAPIGPSVAWAPPPTTNSIPDVAPGLRYADLPSRLVSYVVDVFLVGFVSSMVGSAMGLVEVVTVDGSFGAVGGFGFALVSTAIGAAYFIASWSGGRRATLGQRLFSIQVGNAVDGRSLSTEQAVRRWLGYGQWLSLVGIVPSLSAAGGGLQFLWVIALVISTATSPTRQGLHDRFAGSALVRPTTAGNGLALGCLVALVALFALAVIASMAYLGGAMPELLDRIGDSI